MTTSLPPLPCKPGALQCERLHVAIIMDGNGRWAEIRGKRRLEGHHAGAAAVRRTVEAACHPRNADLVGTLTLFAFSGDNWERPESEVSGLLALLAEFLHTEANALAERGILLSVIGRRDRLPPPLLEAIRLAEQATGGCRGLHLRIAVDYSGRDAILETAAQAGAAASREAFARALNRVVHSRQPAPDVDLLIRTGGELRFSDFMLWEAAYAELVFIPRMWPEFGVADLEMALREFSIRERRFGRIPAA